MAYGWAAPGSTGTGRGREDGPGAAPQPGMTDSVPPPPAPRRELEVDAGLFPLRPLGLGELLGAAFRIYRARPRLVLGLSAIVMAIAFVGTTALTGASMMPMLLQAVSLDDTSTQTDLIGSVRDLVTATLSQLGAGLITLLASSAVTVAVTALTVTEAVRMPLSSAQVRTVLKRRLVPAVLVSLIVSVATLLIWVLAIGVSLLPLILLQDVHWWMLLPLLLCLLFAVLASLWLYGRTILAVPAVTIERIGPIAGLRRSFALTRGRRLWRPLGTALLLAVIAYFASQFLAGALSTVGFVAYFAILLATGGEALVLAASLLLISTMFAAFVASAVLAPFSSSGLAVLYTDARMRHEAWDLTLTATARDGSHAEQFTVDRA